MSTIVLMMSTPSVPLQTMLFGQTRGRVLSLLYSDPKRAFFGREIARLTQTSAGTIQRELNTLREAELVLKENRDGHRVLFRANEGHPVFHDLASLVSKTPGIPSLLQRALKPLEKNIASAFVYGSIARGDALPQSDIDVLLIGDITLDDVLQQCAPLEQILHRPIDPTLYSPDEFASKLRARNHFLTAVMRSKKIFLVGDERELEKWQEFGWLHTEPTSPEEIADQLGLVARAIKDARVDAISDDLRFQAAFSAMLNAANTALRASGFRTRVQTGHHQKIIESLEFTLKAEPKVIQEMRVFSKKRNATSYDAAGGVSEQELTQAIALAEQMELQVKAWLRAIHPELL